MYKLYKRKHFCLGICLDKILYCDCPYVMILTHIPGITMTQISKSPSKLLYFITKSIPLCCNILRLFMGSFYFMECNNTLYVHFQHALFLVNVSSLLAYKVCVMLNHTMCDKHAPPQICFHVLRR